MTELSRIGRDTLPGGSRTARPAGFVDGRLTVARHRSPRGRHALRSHPSPPPVSEGTGARVARVHGVPAPVRRGLVLALGALALAGVAVPVAAHLGAGAAPDPAGGQAALVALAAPPDGGPAAGPTTGNDAAAPVPSV